jgi:hypothetical protein
MTYARICEVRPRKDHRGVDLISDALPFGRLQYGELDAINNAIDGTKFYSRSTRTCGLELRGNSDGNFSRFRASRGSRPSGSRAPKDCRRLQA